MLQRWLVVAILVVVPVSAAAQEPLRVGSELDQYLRLLELDGTIPPRPMYRPEPVPPVVDSAHVWSARFPLNASGAARPTPRLLPVEGTAVFNSTFALSRDDGTLWSGRGFSASLTAGAESQWGPLTLRLNPILTAAQNRPFDHALSPYPNRFILAYPWNINIDFPTRMGFEPFAAVGWGESVARLTRGAFTAALSHESLWWGPGYRNAILMSNTAGGFPHFDLGLARPVRTPIGEFELRLTWGALYESSYFDTLPDNGTRFLAGLVAAYRPSFLRGFSLGFARVRYQNWPAGGLAARHLVAPFSRLFNQGPQDRQNDDTDQLAAVLGRWVVAPGAIEFYFEWARDDFSGNLRDFLVEPNHAGVFTIGLQKSLSAAEGRWRLAAEVTSLGRTQSYFARSPTAGTIYTHSLVIQGYTHRGQPLGAGIGPAGNSQFVGLDRYLTGGRWGVFLERVRYNDDAFYDLFRVRGISYEGRPVDLTVGGSLLRFAGPLDIGARIALTHRMNRDYRFAIDVTNLQVGGSLGWSPGNLARGRH